jgi:signal transduction histidine kinase
MLGRLQKKWQIQFDSDLEREYADFRLPIDIANGRFGFYALIVTQALFILIDFFRLADPATTVLVRCVLIGFLFLLLWVTYKRPDLTVVLVPLFYGISPLILFVSLFDTNAPPNFVTNVLVTLFFCLFTIASVRFFYSFCASLFALISFILFIVFFDELVHHKKHLLNVVVNFLFAFFIGLLWEKQKRKRFLQKREIDRQNEDLQALNAQKAKIISILSHDLAAPLNTLQGLLNIKEAANLTPSEWEEYTNKIQDQLKRTRMMLHDLVRWSKSQGNGYVPSLELVDLSSLIQEVVDILSLQAKEKSVHIVSKISSVEIHTDKEMARLVIRNLVSNGIKFSKPEGTIHLSSFVDNSFVSISIKDEGVGMDENTLDKLFRQNIQSTDGTMKEKGTGIGLLISQEIAGILGGKIEVASKLDEGSTFTLKLPQQLLI